MSKLISIIVPFYNAEQTLEQCIESVVKQTYSNWELIIIDDGSEDNSCIVISKWCKKEKRIKFYQQRNSGVSSARNYALEKVEGEYVTFLDADDWYEPTFLQKLFDTIEKNKADIACCAYCIEMPGKAKKVLSDEDNVCYSGKKILEKIFFEKSVQGFVTNKMMKKSIIKDIYFPENIKLCEDMFFLCEVYRENLKMAYTNCALYHYRINGNGATQAEYNLITMNGGSQILENYQILEKKLPYLYGKNMVIRMRGESVINLLPYIEKYNANEVVKQIKSIFWKFFLTNATIKNKIKFLYVAIKIFLKAR